MKNNLIIRFILMLPSYLVIIMMATLPVNGSESVLKGSDLLEIKPDVFCEGKLVIKLLHSYPLRINPENGIGEGFTPGAAEEIFIFCDGSVYSDRWCLDGQNNKYYMIDYPVDDTWSIPIYGNIIYSRHCKYYLTSEQISELLGIIAMYKGELVEGETILGQLCVATIRIRYNGMEGRLLEPVFTGIENEERMAVIEAALKWIRDIEWNTELELMEWVDFNRELESRKEEVGWPKWWGIRTKYTYSQLKTAREAHGLPYY